MAGGSKGAFSQPPLKSRSFLLRSGEDYSVGVVEGAILDLPTAHRRQRRITSVRKAPHTKNTVEVLGVEDGIAHRASRLRRVVRRARSRRSLDGLQHHFGRLVRVGGVRLGLCVELLLVA